MAARNYKPSATFFKELAVGPEIRSALRDVAEKAKGIAEGLAGEFSYPNPETGTTGEYADSFAVGEATTNWVGKYPGPRAVSVLQNDAPYAVDVEYGKGQRHNSPAEKGHRVLGRTLAALGD